MSDSVNKQLRDAKVPIGLRRLAWPSRKKHDGFAPTDYRVLPAVPLGMRLSNRGKSDKRLPHSRKNVFPCAM